MTCYYLNAQYQGQRANSRGVLFAVLKAETYKQTAKRTKPKIFTRKLPKVITSTCEVFTTLNIPH